jgi:hypothetical protein
VHRAAVGPQVILGFSAKADNRAVHVVSSGKQMHSSTSRSRLGPIDWVLILVIAIYPFLLIWQGGDLTDTGFHAIYSQNFFSDLNEGNLLYKTVLTYLVGHLWVQLFPELGIWGLRLLAALFIQGAVLLVFLTLKDLNPRRVVLVGLLCAQVFALRFTSMVFSYDWVALFFLMLTAYCLWHGVRDASYRWLFASGLISGLAFLARLPSILLLGLVPLVIVHCEWARQGTLIGKDVVWESVKKYAVFSLGFLALFSSIGLLIGNTDAWSLYFEKLLGFRSELSKVDPSATYSLSNLIETYLKDLQKFFPYLLGACAATAAFFIVSNATRRRATRYFLASLCMGFAFLLFYGDFSYSNKVQYFVPALCVVTSVIAFRPHETASRQYRSLVLIGWSIAFVGVAGTATGLFLKLYYGMVLLIPLLGVLLWNRNVENIWKLHVTWRPWLLINAAIIILIGGMLQFGWIYHVNSGLLSRLEAVYPIDHMLMRNIYTTAERAKHIEDVTRAIEIHIRPENSLFIYGHEPLFYYLSQQKPALFSFWMANAEDRVARAGQIIGLLEQSIYQTSRYPLILVTNRMQLGKEGSVLLDRFLEKYNYQCVEDSGNFQVWNTAALSVLPAGVETP